LELASERTRQRLGQQRLAETRHPLHEHVTARDERHGERTHRSLRPDDHSPELAQEELFEPPNRCAHVSSCLLMCRVACSYVELPLGANHEVVKARERHALAGTGARVPVLQLLYLRTIEPRVVLEPPPGRTSARRGAAGARGEPAEEVLEHAPRGGCRTQHPGEKSAGGANQLRL